MRRVVLLFMTLLLLTGMAIAGCAQPAPTEKRAPPQEEAAPEEAAELEPEPPPAEEGAPTLSVSSSAFKAGEEIPAKYTR